MIIKGGHAIMLRVKLSPREVSAARAWLASQCFSTNQAEFWGDDMSGEDKTDNPHLTLAFAGRDLDDTIGEKMIAAAAFAINANAVPDTVTSTGALAVFGRRDHLVAEIDADFQLTRCRDLIVRTLLTNDVPVGTRYAFKPHVSLAKLNCPTTAPHPPALNCTPFPVLGIDVKLGSTTVQLDL